MAVEIGIDLGTASVLVYVKGKGVILKEPSVVAYDRDTNSIKAIGEEARLMLGRTPGKATYAAGAREVRLIEEPVAAAIGAGIDISRPCGNMIVDIGGGTADVAVISLGGTVVNTSIKIAGDNFDDAIVRYVRKKHNLLIGERTAEDIKIKIGSTYPLVEEESMEVTGRNLMTGLPKTVTVTSAETEQALKEPVGQIVEAVISELERTPPELSADILDRGIVLTGGGALLRGIYGI